MPFREGLYLGPYRGVPIENGTHRGHPTERCRSGVPVGGDLYRKGPYRGGPVRGRLLLFRVAIGVPIGDIPEGGAAPGTL